MRKRSKSPHWLLAISFQIAAWVILSAVIVMTLGPLSVRPHTPVSADFDRVVAYVALSLAFALAYPRRIYLIGVALLVAAGGLECAQSLVPGRDGRLEDFLFKVGGTIIGLVTARLVQLNFDKYHPERSVT